MNNHLGCLAVVETSVPGFFGELKINLSTLRLANDKHLTKYRNAGEAPAQLDISVLIQCIEKRASTFHRAAVALLLDFQAENAQQIGNMRGRKRDMRHKTMMFSALSHLSLSLPLFVPHENTTTQPSPALAATPSFDVGPPQIHVPTNSFQIIDNKDLSRANQTVKKQQEQTSRNLEHII